MAVSVLKGRNVKVEVALTFATAKVVTAVSKAKPGVASSAAHGLANGTIGYFDTLVGMSEIDGQAISVSGTAAGTFELQKINTTNFTAFTSGSFTPVATWATLAAATSFQVGGGDASKQDITTLLDTVRQEENGMLAAQSVSIGGFIEAASSAAADAVDEAALNGGFLIFRATWPNGYRVIFRGQPSLAGLDANVDQPVTGGFNCSVKGMVLKLPN